MIYPVKPIQPKYKDRITAIIPLIFGLLFLASIYVTIEFYQTIDHCPDFGKQHGKVKKFIMIMSNLLCLFFFPYFFRIILNLENKWVFVINLIACIGSIIALVLVFLIIGIYFTVPDYLSDVNDTERVKLETEQKCCYTDTINKQIVSEDNTISLEANVYCTCPLLSESEKNNKISSNELLCSYETISTNICCDGTEFQSSNIYIFIFFDAIAFVVGIVSSGIGFWRLQKKFKFREVSDLSKVI